MPNYRHYCYRAHWLDLNDDSRFYMERVYSLTRFIENSFNTKYQLTELTRINPDDFTMKAMWAALVSLENHDTLKLFENIESIYVESALTTIAHQWRRALTGKQDRPGFKKLTDDQVVWVFDPTAIKLYRDTLTIPGLSQTFDLTEAKIRLFGEPVCYYLHRTTTGQYYVVFLYERIMNFPYIHTDRTITPLANQVHAVLCRGDVEQDCDTEALAQAAMLRMRILIKLLAARNNVSVSPTTETLSAA